MITCSRCGDEIPSSRSLCRQCRIELYDRDRENQKQTSSDLHSTIGIGWKQEHDCEKLGCEHPDPK